jgi:hypothetical protein
MVLSRFLTYNLRSISFFKSKNLLLYTKKEQVMKKFTSYIFLLFVIISCQEEVKFNSPSFQGQKDNVFWRAIDSKAKLSGGSLTIEAFTSTETVTLKTASINSGTYKLGNGILNTATYVLTDANGTTSFSTGTAIGDGEIVIDKYDAINKTITGTFKFSAVNINTNQLTTPNLNFQYGHFYKVPVTN